MWRGIIGSFAIASAVGILAIMTLVVVDVVRRKLDGGSIPGANEYAEILLVGVVFLGLAEAQRQGNHISVEAVVARLTARSGARLRSAGLVLSLAVVVWMTWETLDVGVAAFESKEFRFGLARIPTWPAKLAIPIGLAALSLELLRDLLGGLKASRSREASRVNGHV